MLVGGDQSNGGGATSDGGVHQRDDDEVVSTEEEVLPGKRMRTPQAPTQSELDEHGIDHLPYREWCADCVEGFGREDAHTSSEVKATWIPVVSTDYLFVTKRGIFTKTEYEPIAGEEHLKVLVVYDSKSRSLFAHAVPKKGPDEQGYVVECFVDDILWLGYASVIVRSDNEPAIVRLVTDVLAASKVKGLDQAMQEGSIPYDPQSNGAAESAVRLFKGQFRALQLGLERKLKARIPVDIRL